MTGSRVSVARTCASEPRKRACVSSPRSGATDEPRATVGERGRRTGASERPSRRRQAPAFVRASGLRGRTSLARRLVDDVRDQTSLDRLPVSEQAELVASGFERWTQGPPRLPVESLLVAEEAGLVGHVSRKRPTLAEKWSLVRRPRCDVKTRGCDTPPLVARAERRRSLARLPGLERPSRGGVGSSLARHAEERAKAAQQAGCVGLIFDSIWLSADRDHSDVGHLGAADAAGGRNVVPRIGRRSVVHPRQTSMSDRPSMHVRPREA